MQSSSVRHVRPKKSLGQHFLHDKGIARKIVEALQADAGTDVLEIGPGTGVLTDMLLQRSYHRLKVVEIDRDSVAYLREHYPSLEVLEGDFLEMPVPKFFSGRFSVIGNFPYNISSQLFFRFLEHRQQVQQVVCMLQKEVADRIAAPSGNKTYGILSVLLQAFYNVEYLFKVPPGVFNPPPKVMSAVIRLTRNERLALPCDEKAFFAVVKQGFNNRRKTLRNALKNLILPAPDGQVEHVQQLWRHPLLDKRAEQLTVDEFIQLTLLIIESRGAAHSI